MNLWGAAPLFVVALLGSGAHMTAANHVLRGGVAQSPATGNFARQVSGRGLSTTSPSPVPTPSAGPPAGAPSPVLRQVGPTTWETTVLLNDNTPSCSAAKTADYWLATTSPTGKFHGAIAPRPLIVGTSPATKPVAAATATKKATAPAPKGSSCVLDLTFTGVGQTPQTAALIINQSGMSSSMGLTVSRDVTLTFYLWIPACVGGAMALLLFGLSLLIAVYDWDGAKLRGWHGPWWVRPILGSGAWTLNDSWATNISTGLVAVGAVLTATTAANSLFPGIALDRFAIANIVAGAIVLAAPVIFGVYYAIFTAYNPGPTADSTIKLPSGAAVTIEVPSGASITVSGDATVREIAENPRRAEVRAGCTYQVPPGTTIDVQAGIQARAQAVLEAVVRHVAKSVAEDAARAAAKAVRLAWVQAAMLECKAAMLEYKMAAADAVWRVMQDKGHAAAQEAARAAAEAVGSEAVTAAAREAMRAAAQGYIGAGEAFRRVVSQEIARTVKRAVAPAVDWTVKRAVVEMVIEVVAQQAARTTLQAVSQAAEQPVARAKARWDADPRTLPRVQAAEAMALPGTADIGVLPGSILEIKAPGGTWTIQASDQAPQGRDEPPAAPPPPPPPIPWWWQPAPPSTAPKDVHITYPARMEAHGGAKITVVGTADVTFPRGTVMTAPRRRTYTLQWERNLLTPQGTNVLVANMGMLVIANVFTMFGIGAELGLASSLAYFSEAVQPWREIIFIGIAAVALLVIVYAKTATRTMADPQPGSSISAQAGTSFTL